MKKFIVIHLIIVVLLAFVFITMTDAMSETYQKVNPDYKLLNIKTNLEIYTNGEEQLYKLESPHGHWFSPQGFGHSETIQIDFRRFYIDLGIINYIPVYCGIKYQTYWYNPYADSVQVVGQEIGVKIAIYPKNLAIRAAVIPESWSGSQVTSLEYELIGQFINNNSDYYLLNFSLLWHENSFLSLKRYIEKDISWTSSKAINFDFTIDLRALGNYIYFGYRIDHKWNDDPTQLPNNITFTKHSLFLGNSSEIAKDLFLNYEGSMEFKNNTRLARVVLMIKYQTNLE